MRRGFPESMTVAAAVLAGMLAVGFGSANAAPSVSDQEHRLADQIAQGVQTPGAAPIVDGGRAGLRPVAADTAGAGPAQTAWLAALGYGILQPDAAPPGANDWGCRPSAAHPEPVVLLHGTWVNAYETFAYLSGALKNAGYCVFALNYGREDCRAAVWARCCPAAAVWVIRSPPPGRSARS